ncbi:hypothetical protein F8C76_15340 [Flagellimonas olearia]|uniref:Uncharacterized protein n=1 Tax=Flagellimonas olearia TaxID=552546 RepID=A0A6I1DYR8_9FLAO|nr:hypothetical protein [Allomuricauda olearia]KAB7529204.1 hypothetical protein F8C76_15340 [Allomuricauda olearia]
MKAIKTICILLFCLLSCSPEDSDIVTFRMFNDTNHQVKLLAFNKVSKAMVDEINISSKGIYAIKKNRGNSGNFISEAFYSSNNVDSIRMIFNANKVHVFLQTIENNDIFFGDQNREFRITNEYYSMAMVCSAECE